MTPRYIAAIDQGTTSSRCMIFDAAGQVAARAGREHRQIFPRPGWVEHDALEIWGAVEGVVAEAMAALDIRPDDLAAVGITNQRETTLLWDRATGEPIANAVVWQDTRTDGLIHGLARDGGMDRFRERCGLPLATYFSGPKIRWLLDNTPGARERAERGELLFGTMDTWLIWKLTGRHVTEVTNASRTMLMNLETLEWDDTLLAAIGVPRAILPEIRSSSEVYGVARGVLDGVKVASALGDQQAALFGQACFEPGEGKCTYGTGAFLLVNTGCEITPSKCGLLTTVAYRIGDGAGGLWPGGVDRGRRRPGAVAARQPRLHRFGGRDRGAGASSVPDNGGCYVVPAFSGLFAPRWRPDARGAIVGLTAFVTKAHIARAALEAVAWQARELVDAMAADRGAAR